MKGKEIDLPKDIRKKIIAFMIRMGHEFGYLDFIVDKTGTWYFLECNVQVHSLWKEKIIKTVSVLDVFVEFLSWGKPDFKYIPQNKLVTLKELSDMPNHTEYYRRCDDGKYFYDVEYNIKD